MVHTINIILKWIFAVNSGNPKSLYLWCVKVIYKKYIKRIKRPIKCCMKRTF